jgi:hypothetical protein
VETGNEGGNENGNSHKKQRSFFGKVGNHEETGFPQKLETGRWKSVAFVSTESPLLTWTPRRHPPNST